jgi:hypothetical protein
MTNHGAASVLQLQELPQASGVSIHSEVVDVPLHSPRERRVLLLDGQMPMVFTPRVHCPYCARQARTPGLALKRSALNRRNTHVDASATTDVLPASHAAETPRALAADEATLDLAVVFAR